MKIENQNWINEKQVKWYSTKTNILIFTLGLLLLLTDIIILFHYFNIHGIQPLIKQYSDPQIKNLIGQNNFYPNAIAAMWRHAGTFTMISNIVLAVAMISYAVFPKQSKTKYFYFFACVNITITFLIYWTLIFFVSLKAGIWKNLSAAIPSFVLHAINPAIGIGILIWQRKKILLTTKNIWLTNVFVLMYFFGAMITFFIAQPILELKKIDNPYVNYGTVVYSFLNFKEPMFYKGGKLGIVIVLDILMFTLGALLAPVLAYFWKGVLRIKNPNKNHVIETNETQKV
ncbi:MAGa3780 family membrane protein [Metamycoplasma equirhinis]|uniref:MAGa3780 family membrane protein n=1 Tax=Metamycoplasma equirhinis TaxID=92402 RepID=UPI0035932DC2